MMKKDKKRLETKRNKYHFCDGKAKSNGILSFNKTSLQKESHEYSKNLSEEEKEKKNKICKEQI